MTDPHHSTFVEQALQSFRDGPIPSGPSASLVEVTSDRLHSLTAQHSASGTLRRKQMFRIASCSGAMALCASVVALVVWVGMLNHSAGIVFADVQEEATKTRTVRYVSTRLAKYASDSLDEMQDLERKQVKAKPDRIFRTTGDAHQPEIRRVRGRYLQRIEKLNAAGEIDSIQIDDFKSGKHVTLHPKEKRFSEFKTQVTIDFNTGKKSDEEIRAKPGVDLYATISSIPAEAVTQLPSRTLGGKQVVGFYWEEKIEKNMETETWERTYWVDPTTRLPVRIEICHHSTDKRVEGSEWIESGFVFDEEFPDDLFSTEPPEGYTREPQKIYGIKVE